jgi:cytochrome c peroxidase
LACVSCHDLGRGGVDGRQFSVGIGGAIGGINAPSVFNSGFSFAQFWDGRAASLEEQAAGPIHNSS